MNMEKVDQSQNVLALSWYDKNIYFFSNSIFRQLETNLSQDMYCPSFCLHYTYKKELKMQGVIK